MFLMLYIDGCWTTPTYPNNILWSTGRFRSLNCSGRNRRGPKRRDLGCNAGGTVVQWVSRSLPPPHTSPQTMRRYTGYIMLCNDGCWILLMFVIVGSCRLRLGRWVESAKFLSFYCIPCLSIAWHVVSFHRLSWHWMEKSGSKDLADL